MTPRKDEEHRGVAELVRRTIRGFSAYRRGIQNERRTGSTPVSLAN
jgi:hypothetical protein